MTQPRTPFAVRDSNTMHTTPLTTGNGFDTPLKQTDALHGLRAELQSQRKLSQSALKRWQSQQRELVQEQLKTIESLTERTNHLEMRNSELEAKLAKQQTTINELQRTARIQEENHSSNEDTWMDHLEQARSAATRLRIQVQNLESANDKLQGELNLYRDVRLMTLEEQAERQELERQLSNEREMRRYAELQLKQLELKLGDNNKDSKLLSNRMEQNENLEKDKLEHALKSTKHEVTLLKEKLSSTEQVLAAHKVEQQQSKVKEQSLEDEIATLKSQLLSTSNETKSELEQQRNAGTNQLTVSCATKFDSDFELMLLERLNNLETHNQKVLLEVHNSPSAMVQKLEEKQHEQLGGIQNELRYLKRQLAALQENSVNKLVEHRVEQEVNQRVRQLCDQMKSVLTKQYKIEKQLRGEGSRNGKATKLNISKLLERLEHAEQLVVLEAKAKESTQREVELLRKMLYTTQPAVDI